MSILTRLTEQQRHAAADRRLRAIRLLAVAFYIAREVGYDEVFWEPDRIMAQDLVDELVADAKRGLL